nr:MAG TPA: hypothetical protein [Caudoviricetes sp.]
MFDFLKTYLFASYLEVTYKIHLVYRSMDYL